MRHSGSWELGIELLQAGPRADVDVLSGAPTRDGGYLLAALRAQLTLTSIWSVTVRLDNAFNRNYELADGYNTAGRSLSVAMRFSMR